MRLWTWNSCIQLVYREIFAFHFISHNHCREGKEWLEGNAADVRDCSSSKASMAWDATEEMLSAINACLRRESAWLIVDLARAFHLLAVRRFSHSDILPQHDKRRPRCQTRECYMPWREAVSGEDNEEVVEEFAHVNVNMWSQFASDKLRKHLRIVIAVTSSPRLI